MEEFNKALEIYYELKDDYDKNKMNLNENIKCIKCKQDGGTLFTTENNELVAYCNNHSSPCDLDIRLFKGELIFLPIWLSENIKQIEELKFNIMKDKYDLLFGFINEDEALEKFQPKMENFNNLNEIYSKYLTRYLDILYNNKKLLINKNNEELNIYISNVKELTNEYKKAIEEDNLDKRLSLSEEIINLYVNEIYPKVTDMRDLKYEISYINYSMNDDTLYFNLIQESYDYSDLYTYNQKYFPKIISFNV